MSDGGQASVLIIAESVQTFKRHVTTLKLPLVVLLQQECADEVKWLRNGGQLRLRQMRQRSNCVRWCRIHHRQGGQ